MCPIKRRSLNGKTIKPETLQWGWKLGRMCHLCQMVIKDFITATERAFPLSNGMLDFSCIEAIQVSSPNSEDTISLTSL